MSNVKKVDISGQGEEKPQSIARSGAQGVKERQQKAGINALGTLFFDLNGNITECNDSFEQMTGYSRQELRKLNFRGVTSDQSIGATLNKLVDLATKGKAAAYETEMVRKDGSKFWALLAATSLGTTGKNAQCVAFLTDITKAKRAHEETRTSLEVTQNGTDEQVHGHTHELHNLSVSLQNFQSIMDVTHDSVIILDLNGNVIYWNPASEKMYGYRPQDVIGTSLRSFLIPQDKLHEFSQVTKKILGGEPVSDVLTCRIRKDGKRLDVLLNVFALKHENGKIIGTCGIAKDVTGQLAAEAQLRRQHNILTQAEELAQTGSWEYNISTREFFWSDGMYELFQLRKGSHVKPSIYIDQAVEGDRGIAVKIVQCIENTHEPFEEVLRIKPKNKIKNIKVKGAPLTNGRGKVERILGVDMDITREQQSEEAIADLGKELRLVNAELKNFTTIAANNYSETLRHLYIFLELILTHDARNLSNSGRANLRRAQSAIQKMKLLTDDINKYLQLYDMGISKALIDPNKIIQSTLSAMAKKIDESKAEIDMSSLAAVQADPLLFSILITNLVDNAIKFRKLILPPLIRIRSSQADEINALTMAARDTPYTIISVSDNGIGFNDEDADKIFELFFQLDNKGTYKGSGIGLAICKKIMEMHGGFITAEASPAQGAAFCCYFPAT